MKKWLLAAVVVLAGCAAFGGPPEVPFPDCMDPAQPVPWWQSGACASISGPDGGGGE